MQTRILEQIAAHNFTGNNLMADMFGCNNEKHGDHGQNGIQVKLCKLEMRQRHNAGLSHGGKIDNPENCRKHVAGNDRNQHRNHAEEFAEQNGTKHGNAERYKENSKSARVDAFSRAGQQTGGIRSVAGKLQANQSNNRTHRSGRKHNVNPAGTKLVDNKRQHTAQKANDHKTALRIGESFHVPGRILRRRVRKQRISVRGAMLSHDEQGRRNKRKA